MFEQNVGRRVFNGGSYAPNRGQVSPVGYLKRELRAANIRRHGGGGPFGGVSKWGRDGQSDTRSGLAQQMLQHRMQGGPSTGFSGGRPMAGGGQVGAAVQPGGAVKPNGQQPAHVVVGADGTLKLPYNYQATMGGIAQMQSQNDKILAANQMQQAALAAQTEGLRDSGINQKQQQAQLLARMAGRGTAFSSGYTGQLADMGTFYQNQNRDINNTYNTAHTTGEDQKLAATAYMNNWLQTSAANQAQDLHESAGTLGYGTVPVNKYTAPQRSAKGTPLVKHPNPKRRNVVRRGRRKGRNKK